MELEDLEPKNKIIKKKDLSSWNIEDLQEYISRMEEEIDRAKVMIETKQGINSAANALFKRCRPLLCSWALRRSFLIYRFLPSTKNDDAMMTIKNS